MKNGTFEERFDSYVEIVLCSIALFLLGFLLALGTAFGWKEFTRQEDLQWQVLLAGGTVGLLPYLILAAKVWGVSLSLFGNRAAAERQPLVSDAVDKPKDAIEPESGAVDKPKDAIEPESGAVDKPKDAIEPESGAVDKPKDAIEPESGR